jgi:hypothetical protein
MALYVAWFAEIRLYMQKQRNIPAKRIRAPPTSPPVSEGHKMFLETEVSFGRRDLGK